VCPNDGIVIPSGLVWIGVTDGAVLAEKSRVKSAIRVMLTG
jgi:hypothetical protein